MANQNAEDKGKGSPQPWAETKRKHGGKVMGALGYGFIGFDAYNRIKEGENPVVAVGKAALTNAMWSMVPGGLLTAIGYQALTSAPEVLHQLDSARQQINATKGNWGGGFEATEASKAMSQMDMNSMNQSRAELSRAMAGYARKNNNRVY